MRSSLLLYSMPLIAGLQLLAGCSSDGNASVTPPAAQTAQPVEVMKITRRDLVQTLSLVGTVMPNESAQIQSEIAGVVQRIDFTEGQQVRSGEVLLKIEDSELVAQEAQAEVAYELARITLERVRDLSKSRNASQADLDRSTAEFNSARVELALVRSRLAKTEVKAPFNGVVGARSISPGDYVNTQTGITTVDDLSPLKVAFEVPERYLHKVRAGTAFALRSDGSGSAADAATTGKVYFVSSAVNRDTRSSLVKGVLDNAPDALRPGMFANIELVLDVRKQTLTVPEASILNSTQGPQIVLARPNGDDYTAAFIAVELGLRSEGLVEVRASENLENQSVVTAGVGALALYPDSPLSPRPAVQAYSAISQH